MFTVPVSVGFARIEELLNAFVPGTSGSSWYYANVYADDGVTPLGWGSDDGQRADGTFEFETWPQATCLLIADSQHLPSLHVSPLGMPNARTCRGGRVRPGSDQRACRTMWAIRLSSFRTSMPLPSLTLMWPARVHISSSEFQSSVPAFSEDHMSIRE